MVRAPSLRRWLGAYWAATALSVMFLVLAITGDDVPGASYFALVTGAVASVAGALMATALVRRNVDAVDFIDATSAMRIVVVAWTLLIVAMLGVTLAAAGFGARPSAGPEAVQAIVEISEGVAAQLFGAGVLFVMVGDGYTKYRRLTVADESASA